MMTGTRPVGCCTKITTATLLSLIAMLVLIHPANARCYLDNSAGVPLPPYLDPTTKTIACLPGFYCRDLDPKNSSTYPVYCPPTSDCMEKRATGDTCKRQGDFEPQLVPKGHFSRDGATLEECPSGYFCPIGTQEPIKCPALTACPAGASRKYHYGVVVFLVLSIIVLAAIVHIYRKFYMTSVLQAEAESDDGFDISNASTPRNNGWVGGEASATSSNNSRSGTPTSAMSPQNRSKKVQLLCDGFKRRRGGRRPLSFEFNNLRVAVPLEGGKKKNLLNDVSGHFSSGKVTAIMGPSGAGKTTLMNSILGKMADNVTRSGQLHVNGEATQMSQVRHMIGFVPQDDVLHSELSTYKNLYYSSEIRLPNEWSSRERHLFRSAVIEILDLAVPRDIVVGDEFERGISKSQRKRASIGLELAAAPLAMFLDEPTSGLDSFASMELCLLLREIALQTHLCVAMVIHQPRAEIWNTLDEVLILAPGGYTVYQGPQSESQAYFRDICGVEFSPEVNPADAIMDAVAERATELVETWTTYKKKAAENEPPKKAHNKSADAQAVDIEGEPEQKIDNNEAQDDEQGMSEWPGASIPRQILLSHNRSIEKQLTVMQPFIIEIFVAALSGIILGQANIDFEHASTYRSPYEQISIQPFNALLPQVNLYALMSLSLAGATAGVRVLSEPMKNYYRETAAGHSPLSFLLGAIWAATYRMVLSTLAFTTFFHVIPGQPYGFGQFYYTYLAAYFCMYALAAPISVVATKRNAPLFASLTGITCAIFSGFVDFPVWMKHLSFGFYTAQTIHLANDEVIETAMTSTFEDWGYSDMHPGLAAFINIIWGTALYSVGFVLLVRYNREKQR